MTRTLPYRAERGAGPGLPAVLIDAPRVLGMVREGATNADIAAAFYCCTRTLERWRSRNPDANAAIIAERARLADLFRWN